MAVHQRPEDHPPDRPRQRLQIALRDAGDDLVAVRYTARGTFVAPFRGHQPTGTSYELVAIEWFVVQDRKIHRRWGARDSAAQARQLGLPLG